MALEVLPSPNSQQSALQYSNRPDNPEQVKAKQRPPLDRIMHNPVWLTEPKKKSCHLAIRHWYCERWLHAMQHAASAGCSQGVARNASMQATLAQQKIQRMRCSWRPASAYTAAGGCTQGRRLLVSAGTAKLGTRD